MIFIYSLFGRGRENNTSCISNCSLLIGVISFDDAFAKEHKEPKPPKTLESECAKKKPNSFDGLFCEAVFGLQQAIDAAVGDFQGQIDDLVSALATETSEREAADTALQTAIDADGDTDSSNELELPCDGCVDAQSIAANSISTSKIIDQSIGTADIQRNSISGALITDGSITAIDLAVGSVGTREIADGSIAGIDIGTLKSPNIPDNLITSRMVSPNTLTGIDIKDNAISLHTRLVEKFVVIQGNSQASAFLTCGIGEVVGGIIPSFVSLGDNIGIKDVIALPNEQYQIVYFNNDDGVAATELWYLCITARADVD